jgi:cytochrome P450
VLTRYADVVAALKHPRLSSRQVLESGLPVPPLLRWALGPINRVLGRQMLFSDPPDHTRLRSLASRAFTPRRLEALRPRVEAVAEELLDRKERSGRADLIGDFAVWLPLIVIAELLGVPVRHRQRFKTWSDDLAQFIGGTTRPMPGVLLRAARSLFQFRAYFGREIRRRRGRPGDDAPGDDLLGALIAAEEQGDALTEEELLANCVLLLAAGHETTTNLIGNGLHALLRHPEQADLLRREPGLIGSAVEELLRFDSPVQWTGRVAAVELEIAGRRVPAGQTVAMGIGAANRDPAQFPEPDRLDLRRAENRHLAFGQGIHFCLGAALARLEGQVAVSAVLRRYPDLRLADERPEWHDNFTLRGLKSLRVHLR